MKTLRIEQLAAEAGIAVSTIRYYHYKKILDAPQRKGRYSIYTNEHLARLKEIRRLTNLGLTIRQLHALLNGTESNPILSKLITSAPITQKALVEKSGVDSGIVNLAIKAGLIQPIHGTTNRYYADAVEMLKAADTFIKADIDTDELFKLAKNHKANIEKTADLAVNIFAKSIKQSKAKSNTSNTSKNLSRAELSKKIEHLMMETVKLVSIHFRQTLFSKATEFISNSSTVTKSKKDSPTKNVVSKNSKESKNNKKSVKRNPKQNNALSSELARFKNLRSK